MNHVRFIVFSFCIFCCIEIGVAQRVANPTWTIEDKEGRGGSVVFEEFGQAQKYLAVYNSGGSDYEYLQSTAILLDKDGQELWSKKIENDSLDLWLLKSFYNPSTNTIRLFGFGAKAPYRYIDKEYLVSLEIDESGSVSPLSIVKLENGIAGISEPVHLGYSDMGYYFDGQGYKIVASSGFNFLYIDDMDRKKDFQLTFLDMAMDGSILNQVYLDDLDVCYCILPSVIDEGFHCPGGTGFNLDKNMNITGQEISRTGSKLYESRWPFSLFFRPEQSCFPWINGTYLIANTGSGYNYPYWFSNGSTVVFNYTPLDYKMNHIYSTREGDLAFLFVSMDIAKDSMIYTGSISVDNTGYSKIATISKLDKELKEVWKASYKVGDKSIFGLGIRATSDLGFVMYGLNADERGLYNYPFIAKFGPDGGYSWTNDASKLMAIKSYPNPSSGKLNLDMKGIIGTVDIRVFDMEGKNVFVQSVVDAESDITLDLSGLIPGNYVYKLYQGGQCLFSSNWIKI